MSNLRKDTVSSLSWTAGGQLVNRLSGFVISIILARILSPDDFGLMAIVLVFVGIAQVFQNSGFGAALIQNQKVVDKDYSSVFYFNIASAFVLTLLLIIASDKIAQFYERDILSPMLKLLSLNIILAAFGAVQNIRYRKHLKMNILVKIDISSVIISGSLAVLLAANDYGVWSLIVQSLAMTAISTLAIWFLSKWRPKFYFSLESIRKLFGFSYYVFLTRVFARVFEEIESLLIGKMYAFSQLGIYNRAKSIQRLPFTVYSATFTQVLFPYFSRIQEDEVRMKNNYAILIHFATFTLAPVSLMISALSYPIVFLLLGEKWIEAAPMLFLFSLIGFFNPISAINLNIFLSKGRSRFAFRFSLIKRFFSIAVILSTIPFGIFPLIYGIMAYTVLGFFANLHFAGRLISFTVLEQIKIMTPYVIVASVTATICHLTYLLLNSKMLLATIVASTVSVAVYYLLNRTFKLKALPMVVKNSPFSAMIEGKRIAKYLVW